MNLDKSKWTKVKLSDVVIKKEENDRENAHKRFDRFLKVEHMDAESLHIKRWSSQKDGDQINPTFYKIFRKGQILFPTRNPHLRRTALAKFDGICGEKTLTLEPDETKLLPSFIPFLFHSDAFYAHTTSSIIGSTNPHCRWRDVANFEFLLPPKDQQAKIAELLWASDTSVQSNIILKNKLDLTLNSEIESKIHGESINRLTIDEVVEKLSRKINIVDLNSLGEVLRGKGIPKSDVISTGIPCVRYGELYTKHHRVIRNFYSSISNESANKAVKLEKNDILFAGSGETITEIGKSAAFISDHVAYAGSDILIFRPESMDGVYLGYLMNSQLVRQQLNKFGTGATVMHVYASDIEKIKVPEVSKSEQIEIGQFLEKIEENIIKLEEKIVNAQLLQQKIINQVFQP